MRKFFLFVATLVQLNVNASVLDPYAWLEEGGSEETQQWLKQQTEVFTDYMQHVKRDNLKERLTKISECDDYSLPVQVNDSYFFTQKLAAQEQMTLFIQEGFDSTPRLLFDPSTIEGSEVLSLAGFAPSHNGKYVAIGLIENGSDWTVWKIQDVATGEFLSDAIDKIKFFGITWDAHCDGCYYPKFVTETLQHVYYHKLGTSTDKDVLVYGNEALAGYLLAPFITNDSRYLCIAVNPGTMPQNGLLIKDLHDEGENDFRELLSPGHAKYEYVHNEGSCFYFLTDEDAPLGKGIVVDVAKEPFSTEQTIIPQGNYPLECLRMVGDKLIGAYLVDTYGQLKVFDKSGNWQRDVQLPQKDTVHSAYRDLYLYGTPNSPYLFFGFTNFIQPISIYRYDTEADALDIFKKPSQLFDPEQYTIEQVFYSSKDGTKVPMSIVYKNGIDINGHPPTFLYGYGGFGISIVPEFNIKQFAWVDRGGILAVANIRGGAEYGEEWHKAAVGAKKQKCFDDFIAAAEWLIDHNYTDSSRLAICGRSNGGLLTGACLTQRPELFGAVSVEMGVLDMLRFHLFTVGWAWMGEFGNPDKAEDFEVLHKYSPYHNVREGTHYPATLICTAEYDDRVVPLHSYKFAAALQAANRGENPIILRVDTKAGHGSGKSSTQQIDEWADIIGFLWDAVTLSRAHY